ncbi:glycosyltransferase [Microcoleus sp. FACHB-68]|uniref:glycosyltransferase family protein n=1 Tax=Microcoleus sp. FACHB-68 TaxID=2692826 RepID=UPI0016895157|nr:glycosyltransferase [Microcoleus sp. FACHB-68]MBD1940411.1 glycosyltransferase [Microcoleus sp. FACHB-68]
MSYRFVKVTTHYKEYLNDYYRRNGDVVHKTYQEQMQHIMAEAYGWADFFTTHLMKLGVDACEIIANALPLQQAWAQEHGLKSSGKNIVMAQLKALQPDVIFFQDSFRFNGEWITYLKEQVPSIKQVIGWVAAPHTADDIQQFKVFDYMLTSHPGFRQQLKDQGLSMYQFNHGFEASLLPKISYNDEKSVIDCTFIGSLYKGEGLFNERVKMLETLLESNITLKISGDLPKAKPSKILLKQAAYITAKTLKNVGLTRVSQQIPGLKAAVHWTQIPQAPYYSENLIRVIQPPLYGINMLRVLSCGKVGLNFHGDASGPYAGNIRLYEVTGVGSCLLTDWKENLHELFELDREVVTYKSADECIEKAKWLLENPLERELIAKAGQARTLKDHTYEKRAVQLNQLINKNF